MALGGDRGFGVPNFILLTFTWIGEDRFLFKFLPPRGVFGVFPDLDFLADFFRDWGVFVTGDAATGSAFETVVSGGDLIIAGELTGADDLAFDLAEAAEDTIGVLKRSEIPEKLTSMLLLLLFFPVDDFLPDFWGDDFLADFAEVDFLADLAGKDFLGVPFVFSETVPDNDFARREVEPDLDFAGAVLGVACLDVLDTGVFGDSACILYGDVDFLGEGVRSGVFVSETSDFRLFFPLGVFFCDAGNLGDADLLLGVDLFATCSSGIFTGVADLLLGDFFAVAGVAFGETDLLFGVDFTPTERGTDCLGDFAGDFLREGDDFGEADLLGVDLPATGSGIDGFGDFVGVFFAAGDVLGEVDLLLGVALSATDSGVDGFGDFVGVFFAAGDALGEADLLLGDDLTAITSGVDGFGDFTGVFFEAGDTLGEADLLLGDEGLWGVEGAAVGEADTLLADFCGDLCEPERGDLEDFLLADFGVSWMTWAEFGPGVNGFVPDLPGDFFADLGVTLLLVLVVAGAWDSSCIGELCGTATDLLFNNGDDGGLGDAVTLGGNAPFLTGVDGGSFLTKYSGLSLGPNETRFLFADGGGTSPTASDSAFLFFPLLLGVFLTDWDWPMDQVDGKLYSFLFYKS